MASTISSKSKWRQNDHFIQATDENLIHSRGEYFAARPMIPKWEREVKICIVAQKIFFALLGVTAIHFLAGALSWWVPICIVLPLTLLITKVKQDKIQESNQSYDFHKYLLAREMLDNRPINKSLPLGRSELEPADTRLQYDLMKAKDLSNNRPTFRGLSKEVEALNLEISPLLKCSLAESIHLDQEVPWSRNPNPHDWDVLIPKLPRLPTLSPEKAVESARSRWNVLIAFYQVQKDLPQDEPKWQEFQESFEALKKEIGEITSESMLLPVGDESINKRIDRLMLKAVDLTNKTTIPPVSPIEKLKEKLIDEKSLQLLHEWMEEHPNEIAKPLNEVLVNLHLFEKLRGVNEWLEKGATNWFWSRYSAKSFYTRQSLLHAELAHGEDEDLDSLEKLIEQRGETSRCNRFWEELTTKSIPPPRLFAPSVRHANESPMARVRRVEEIKINRLLQEIDYKMVRNHRIKEWGLKGGTALVLTIMQIFSMVYHGPRLSWAMALLYLAREGAAYYLEQEMKRLDNEKQKARLHLLLRDKPYITQIAGKYINLLSLQKCQEKYDLQGVTPTWARVLAEEDDAFLSDAFAAIGTSAQEEAKRGVNASIKRLDTLLAQSNCYLRTETTEREELRAFVKKAERQFLDSDDLHLKLRKLRNALKEEKGDELELIKRCNSYLHSKTVKVKDIQYFIKYLEEEVLLDSKNVDLPLRDLRIVLREKRIELVERFFYTGSKEKYVENPINKLGREYKEAVQKRQALEHDLKKLDERNDYLDQLHSNYVKHQAYDKKLRAIDPESDDEGDSPFSVEKQGNKRKIEQMESEIDESKKVKEPKCRLDLELKVVEELKEAKVKERDACLKLLFEELVQKRKQR